MTLRRHKLMSFAIGFACAFSGFNAHASPWSAWMCTAAAVTYVAILVFVRGPATPHPGGT
jgi:uncharacterized membrane protein